MGGGNVKGALAGPSGHVSLPQWGAGRALTIGVSAGTAALLSGTLVGVVVVLLFSRCCLRRAASCSSWKGKCRLCVQKAGSASAPLAWCRQPALLPSAHAGTPEAQRSPRACAGAHIPGSLSDGRCPPRPEMAQDPGAGVGEAS